MKSDQVNGRWVHAQEEDTMDEMVFRPAGTELPPARGRISFELRAGGDFAETGLGADDAPEKATGNWALEGDTIKLSKGATQGVPRQMQVLRATKERLVIRKTQ
jgi:hypothetical protein